VPEDIENSNSKNKFKIIALLREYREIRSEIRAIMTIEMTFLALSILIFAIMFISSTLSNQYILLFISPLLSILFLIIGMSMFAYQTNLGLLASEIEDNLNEILGASVMKYESSVGILRGRSKDFLIKRIGRFWQEMTLFGVGVGITILSASLWYGFAGFYKQVGLVASVGLLLVDIGTIITIIILGYRFFKGSWIKVKMQIDKQKNS
jgi:hypothetical protein